MDPRVRRQIRTLLPFFEIHTGGITPAGLPGEIYTKLDAPWEHLNYPRPIRKFVSLIIKVRRYIYYNLLKNYDRFFMDQTVKNFISKIKDIPFDLIIANDVETFPLAVKLKKKNTRLIFDLHEFAPRQFEDDKNWVNSRQAFCEYAVKNFLPLADASFTVGELISLEYEKYCNIKPLVMTNATEYKEFLTPLPVKNKIRMVHHGFAIAGRKIEEMILMMDYLNENYELYFLLSRDNDYLAQLKKIAEKNKNIFFLDPVPSDKLAEELNKYDIGIYILAPTNINNFYALPNKFFEFVQARLAIAIGPSPEMASYIKKHDLGVVAGEFTASSLADEIRKLSAEKIMHFKNQSHRVALQLSSEPNKKLLLDTVNQLLKD
ncbi:MAG: hypothetical protein ABI723_23990 [Bacteroidia bacterium]